MIEHCHNCSSHLASTVHYIQQVNRYFTFTNIIPRHSTALLFSWRFNDAGYFLLLYPGAGDNATGVRDLQRRTNGVMEAMSNSTLSARSYAQPHRALVFERQTPCCGTRNGCGEVTHFKVLPKKSPQNLVKLINTSSCKVRIMQLFVFFVLQWAR